MRPFFLAASGALLALLAACNSTPARRVVDADEATRAKLFGAISQLEGRWTGTGPDGNPAYTEFAVSSAGSAVREIMMPGTPHEMTNMYTLDGNTLVMTHYCAAGNQPRMRARNIDGNRIEFRFDGVSDLKAPDEVYMGEMTLEIIDKDHVIEHWRSFRGGEPDMNVDIEMTRVR